MADTQFPLGFIEYQVRTNEQRDASDRVMAAMPRFSMPSQGKPEVGTKILLPDLWKHPKVVDALGFAYPGWHQITGSCVGVAGGDTCFTVCCVDVLRNNEPEKIVIPWWPYNYGRSRLLGGMRGKGEGSFGSTFAQSCVEDGTPDMRLPELVLPQPKNTDGLILGKQVELEWSDGTRASQPLRDEAKKRLIRTVTPVSSAEGVRDAILNGYGCTRAFSTYVNPGSATVKNGALVGRYNGRGGHQESWLGYWNHPQNGELIWEQNQWGLNVYGQDPGGGPLGGCWIPIDEVDRQCKAQYAEVFAFSQYEGYPAQPDVYDWANSSFFS